MRLAVIGTDTGVGKTRVVERLARALRARGQRVWLHKPIACGGWADGASEDGRRLRALGGDGQDPASICPHEFPEPASPHLAAAAAGRAVTLAELVATVRALDVRAGPAWLILETAGGLLTPISCERASNAELLAALGWPLLLVTRPHLGTLNHTCLTVNEARRRGLRLVGLVINAHAPADDSLAVRTAPAELARLTGVPLLAVLPYMPAPDDGGDDAWVEALGAAMAAADGG